MIKKSSLVYILIGVLPFIVYRSTSSSAVGFVDSGLLGAAAKSLGIAIPTGFPAYMLMAHLFTRLPFGTVTERLYLLSNLSGAVAVVLTFWLIYQLIGDEKKHTLIRPLAALLGSLSLAFSYQFWSAATKIETFSATALALVGLLILLIVLGRSWQTKNWQLESQAKYLLFGLAVGLGFSGGLSPTLVVILPTFVLWAIFYYQGIMRNLPLFITAAAVACLTLLAVFSYIPVRAAANPFLNFGQATTVGKALDVALGQGLTVRQLKPEGGVLEVIGFHFLPPIMWESFTYYWQMFFYQFNPPFLPVIFWGAWGLYRKDKKLLVMLLAIPITDLALVTPFLSGNQEDWMLPSWVIAAVFLGLGVSFSATLLLSKKPPLLKLVTQRKKAAYGLVLMVSILPALFWYPRLNHSGDYFLNDFLIDLYQDLPKNAVIIGNDNFFEAQTAYAREAWEYRQDVAIVEGNLLYDFDWYRSHLASFAGLQVTPTVEEMVRTNKRRQLSKLLVQFMEDNPDKHFFLTPLFLRSYLQDTVSQSCGSGVCQLGDYTLFPHGLLFKLAKKEEFVPSEKLVSFRMDSEDFLKRQPFYLEEMHNAQYRLLGEWYGLSFEAMGDYLMAKGEEEKAINFYQKAVGVNGGPEFIYRLATAYERVGQLDLAKQFYERVLVKVPNDPLVRQNYNLFLQKISSQSAQSVTSDWQSYSSKIGISFAYPKGWKVSSQGQVVSIKGKEDFTIEMAVDEQRTDQLIDDYLKSQTQLYGTLINQGLAQIPNFPQAYVKIWEDFGTQKMEFFLFQGNKVVKILVHPSDSPLMKVFDQIIQSFDLKYQ